MKSTWICSRNDIISNVGILFAALILGQTGFFSPDVIIGIIIASLFLNSAISVLKEERHGLLG
jgi:Co/Zn/Cd efflux system component